MTCPTSPFDNLINVFFDKKTGQFILKDIDIEGIPAGLFSCVGYVHLQPAASELWTIVHNQNTEYLSGVHIIDGATNLQVFPNQIRVVDVNTIEIDFNTAMAGRAMLVLFLS